MFSISNSDSVEQDGNGDKFGGFLFNDSLCATCSTEDVLMCGVIKYTKSCQRLEAKSNSHLSFLTKKIQFASGKQIA